MADSLSNPTIKNTPLAGAPGLLLGVSDDPSSSTYREVHAIDCYEAGYTEAATWDELVTLQTAGTPSLVCSQLTATGAEELSGASIKFTPTGSIDTAGFIIKFDSQLINVDNHRIFFNYVTDTSYPNRWDLNGAASSVYGEFGGDNNRDPRWWGMVTTFDVPTQAVRDLNADAINASILSGVQRTQFSGHSGVVVRLPEGGIYFSKTIRADGVACSIIGHSRNATLLQAYTGDPLNTFDESWFLTTTDFGSGTVPAIQTGYTTQAGIPNVEEGFGCRIKNVTVICDIDTTLPMSGIMWESAVQENSEFKHIAIQSHAGYGIGGPESSRSAHNVAGSGVPVINTVAFSHLNIITPSSVQAIGLAIRGVNFTVQNSTVIHRAGVSGSTLQERPAILIAATGTCSLRNIHIEISPAPLTDEAVGVFIPDDGNYGAIDLTNVYTLWAGGGDLTNKAHITVRIENGSTPLSCSSIKNSSSYTGGPFPVHAIWDFARSKVSTGIVTTGRQQMVALYARQNNSGTYTTYTTDPGLV